ncbi:hypothetical protein FKW77_004296 [Venturia effusa]|uniref:Aminoglycoside phosphotransferase domain-containing protein n=1 Tax=Venturia effusa TaxID=50376 RepID=A0A517LC83_9PEZI|nr:hypothetical protein FKW77_004296 [Venturia effusa]
MASNVVSYEDAIASESDTIREEKERRKTAQFISELEASRCEIELETAHHLCLPSQRCLVSKREHWKLGRFNVGVRVDMPGHSTPSVLMRYPLPNKLSDGQLVEEKMRCEIATYAYMQDNCPDVPIANLIGFGLPSGKTYTHARHTPTHQRLSRYFWRSFYSCLTNYISHPYPHPRKFSYIMLEYVERSQGVPLVSTWEEHRADPVRRHNLYKGMSKIALSLAQKPWPRIGSLTFLDDATYKLLNRPLSCHVAILGNNGSESMRSDDTYTDGNAYVTDLLAYQESRFVQQPNAVFNEFDCRAQMAVFVLTRLLIDRFSTQELRTGPFYLSFTDENAGHFFVDENWNVTKVVDLEWVCSCPAAMSGTPYWLSGCGIDQIYDEKQNEFADLQEQYLIALRQNESERKWCRPLSHTMEHNWRNGAFWFFHGLTSIDALYNISKRHLLCDVMTQPGWESASDQFAADPQALVRKKVDEKAKYDAMLQQLYGIS